MRQLEELEVLRPQDVARLLKVHRASVYRMLQRGELRGIRVGAQIRVPVREIRRLLDEQGVAVEQ